MYWYTYAGKQIKKAPKEWENDINSEAPTTANSQLMIDDRVHKLHKQQAFIPDKDDKSNFPNNLQFRLLNPSKRNIDRIKKTILERACNYTRNAAAVNKWTV